MCLVGLIPSAARFVGEPLLTRRGGVGPQLFTVSELGAVRLIPGAWLSLDA